MSDLSFGLQKLINLTLLLHALLLELQEGVIKVCQVVFCKPIKERESNFGGSFVVLAVLGLRLCLHLLLLGA